MVRQVILYDEEKLYYFQLKLFTRFYKYPPVEDGGQGWWWSHWVCDWLISCRCTSVMGDKAMKTARYRHGSYVEAPFSIKVEAENDGWPKGHGHVFWTWGGMHGIHQDVDSRLERAASFITRAAVHCFIKAASIIRIRLIPASTMWSTSNPRSEDGASGKFIYSDWIIPRQRLLALTLAWKISCEQLRAATRNDTHIPENEYQTSMTLNTHNLLI